MSDTDNPTPPPAGTSTTQLDAEEKNWGMFSHLAVLLGFVIPFGNIIGPLVVWQLKKGVMPFAAKHAKEALNFQITVSLAVTVCILLTFVGIGILLLPVVGIGALVLTIVAAIKANNGEDYEYPLTLRLVS